MHQLKSMRKKKEYLIQQLSSQTILTEDDWIDFKTGFEKLHPSFFITLKEIAPDITIAEQRMAALLRIQLLRKKIAQMLGISPGSVHKTCQRLRLRLHLPPEKNLEEFIQEV